MLSSLWPWWLEVVILCCKNFELSPQWVPVHYPASSLILMMDAPICGWKLCVIQLDLLKGICSWDESYSWPWRDSRVFSKTNYVSLSKQTALAVMFHLNKVRGTISRSLNQLVRYLILLCHEWQASDGSSHVRCLQHGSWLSIQLLEEAFLSSSQAAEVVPVCLSTFSLVSDEKIQLLHCKALSSASAYTIKSKPRCLTRTNLAGLTAPT